MTSLPYATSSVDVVLEKATLDALLAAERSQWRVSKTTSDLVDRTLCEVSRVLKPGGRFLSHTFAQAHFRLPFYARPEYGWSVGCRELADAQEGFHFYYYGMVKGGALDEAWVTERLKVGSLQIQGDEKATMSDDGDADYFGNMDL